MKRVYFFTHALTCAHFQIKWWGADGNFDIKNFRRWRQSKSGKELVMKTRREVKDAQAEGDIEVYHELLVRKVRAEGVQKGSNLITDAWTFANMRMMTIFLRSFFLADTTDDPGLPELGFIWLYTLVLFVLTPTAPSLHHANRLVL